MRVLLADDSDLILERLQEMVSIYNQAEIVGSFKNGTETLEALRILKPDLAIVDIKMPGLSGLKVLNEIRKEDKTIIFIILTFYSSDYYRQLAIQSGADYFFSKVDDFEKVSLVVGEMVLKECNDNRIKMANNGGRAHGR
ncbi:MAG: response regulator transcription factor [Bacteroidales bacterium]|nr:response regulator transcription factor [Bacteroidales bacterium]